MTLTWKDAVATLLVGAAGLITFAKVKGYDWPLLGSWRLASVALIAISLGACIIIGIGAVPAKNTWTTTATILGGTSFALFVTTLITNSKVAFLALAIDIAALWMLTTLHHTLVASN